MIRLSLLSSSLFEMTVDWCLIFACFWCFVVERPLDFCFYLELRLYPCIFIMITNLTKVKFIY